jgi:biopolymer transport protein ExbD
MSTQNKTLPINCTGADINNEECKAMEDNVVKQFKIIVVVVFIILLCFLGFFVYNLIKCYLPKWRGQNKLQEEGKPVEIKVSNNDSSLQEKNQIELNTS